MDNERHRSDALHDVACKLGVETSIRHIDGLHFEYHSPRPRLDIAHECLGKLPKECSVKYNGYHKHWSAETERFPAVAVITVHGTFEEAVIALAERFLATESRGDS